jgi:hypothetical protein
VVEDGCMLEDGDVLRGLLHFSRTHKTPSTHSLKG